MSNAAFYKRSYHLTFTDEVTGVSKTYTDLDIKFNISRMIVQAKMEASIDVLGLSWNTINEITATSIMSPPEARQLRKRVTLTAGYDGNEMALFTGYISYAICDPPPEMWLHMKADNYNEDVSSQYQLSIAKGTRLKDVFNYAANKIGFQPKWEYTGDNKECSEMLITCNSKTGVIKAVNDLADWMVFYDNQFLFACDNRDKASIGTVNRNTGLIRVNKVDYVGVAFQTWIRNEYPLAAYVNLESELIPAANGKYFIVSKTFNGHYRGNEWFTIYDCIRYH